MSGITKTQNIILLSLSVILFISGLVTLLPYKNIDDECFLGYKALCAFTPFSTIILIGFGVFLMVVRSKLNK